jgi:hypothetical protein
VFLEEALGPELPEANFRSEKFEGVYVFRNSVK